MKHFLLVILFSQITFAGSMQEFFKFTWNHQTASNLAICKLENQILQIKFSDKLFHLPIMAAQLTSTSSKQDRNFVFVIQEELDIIHDLSAEELVPESNQTLKGSFNLGTGKLSIQGKADQIFKCNLVQ